jgi:hypothetical protein
MIGDKPVVESFKIIHTNDGFMIEFDDGCDNEYIHAPNGDNLFVTYHQTSVVLAQYLLRNLLREESS